MSRPRTLATLATIAAFLLAPSGALAWGPQGHRLVADVAWEHLSPAARVEAQALLQGEADPTLAGIANWADQLRELDPDLGRRSARWHYVNIGEHDCRYRAHDACAGGDCVVEAIHAQAAILADHRQPVAARAQALKFVVHFVGDVHQPLHAGHGHDKGGNTVQVNLDGDGSNLHRLWDSGLLGTSGLDDRAYLTQLQLLEPSVRAPASPFAAGEWAEQSCRIVLQPGFYPARARIGGDYVQKWRPVAEARLRDAGVELAALLEAALTPQR